MHMNFSRKSITWTGKSYEFWLSIHEITLFKLFECFNYHYYFVLVVPLFDIIAWGLQKNGAGWKPFCKLGHKRYQLSYQGTFLVCLTLAGCDGCETISCTILVMDAGIRGALTLRLVLRGLWVDDSRVSLLEHLLNEGICAYVVLTVWPTILLHCEGTNAHWIRVMIEAEHVFSIDAGCTYETLTFAYEMQ